MHLKAEHTQRRKSDISDLISERSRVARFPTVGHGEPEKLGTRVPLTSRGLFLSVVNL